jgi:hypothetical protein
MTGQYQCLRFMAQGINHDLFDQVNTNDTTLK